MAWRKTLKLALFLVVVEGAIRKWLLPQLSDYVYFLKDIAFLTAYFQYFMARGKYLRFSKYGALSYMFGLCIIIVTAQAFNPNLGSPLPGLFGSRSYLIYLPLFFLVGDMFDTVEELQTFLRKYLLLAFPVCLLGIVQFFSPPDSPLNTYVTSQNSTATVQDIARFGEEDRTRATGTFPYISGYSAYVFTWMLLGLGVWLNTKEKKWKITLALALVLLQINLFMTGSRYPVYSSAIALVIFTFLGLNSFSTKERRSIVSLSVIAVFLAACIALTPAATEAFLDRANTAGDSAFNRFFGAYIEPFDSFDQVGLTGYGAGMTQSGSDALRRAFNLPDPIQSIHQYLETEPNRVLFEIGPIGFLAWYFMRVSLLWYLWATYKRLRLPFLRQLALLAFLIHLLNLGNQMMLNTTFGVYYWFLSGFVILLPRLERNYYSQAYDGSRRV